MLRERAALGAPASSEASRRDALLLAEYRDPLGHLLHTSTAILALFLCPLGIVPAEIGFWTLTAVSALRSWTLLPVWIDVLRWPCTRWLIALAAFAAISISWSSDPALGVARLKFLRAALWAFLLWPVLGDPRARPRLLIAFLAGVVVLALTQITGAAMPFLAGTGSPAHGTGGLHGESSKAALWCAAGLCIATGALGQSDLSRSRLAAALAVAAIAASGILLAGSLRVLASTCLALVLSAALVLLISRQMSRWQAAAIAIAAGLAIGTWSFAPALIARAASELSSVSTTARDATPKADFPSEAARREFWWSAQWHAFLSHPIAGYGWGSTPTVVRSSPGTEEFVARHHALKEDDRGILAPSQPHSLYMMTLGELGAIGSVLLLAAIGAALRSSIGAATTHPLYAGVCAALLMWLVAAAGDTVTNSNVMALGTVLVTLSMGAQPVPRRSRAELSADAMGKIRVAVFVEKFGMPGGSERFTQETVLRMADTGRFEFHVFANRWSCSRRDIRFYKVPMVRFPRPLRPWLFVHLAKRMIERGQFDVIHSHHAFPGADIVSLHGTTRRFWVEQIQRRTVRLFDRVSDSIEASMMAAGAHTTFMPVSTLVIETYRRSFGQLPGHWSVVHPGADTARLCGSPDARRAARDSLGVRDDELVFLFVGMNFEVKGLQRIIASLAIAAPRMAPLRVRLLVVGRGDRERYVELSRALGIGDRVSFEGVQDAGLERYYQAADAFIMLSAYETFCMAVLEAMAAGLPVIIAERMGIRDLVRDGEHGYVLGVDASAADVADRVVNLGDAQLRARLGGRGREVARSHDWSGVAARLAEEYSRVARAARG